MREIAGVEKPQNQTKSRNNCSKITLCAVRVSLIEENYEDYRLYNAIKFIPSLDRIFIETE